MPELARTLEMISEHGYDVFYNGNLSRAIVREVASTNGHLTENDLKNYNVVVTKPIEVRLTKKLKAFVMQSPSSGVLVTFILKIMKSLCFI